MSSLRVPLVLLIGFMLMYDGYCLAAREKFPSFFFQQSGLASWYDREEQGKPTANGEVFNRHEFTAASRHLPLTP